MGKKKERFKMFIAITLVLAMVAGVVLPSLTAFAETEGSGQDHGQAAGGGKYSGGPSYAKTGWLCYVLDEDSGAKLSPTTALYYCYSAPPSNISSLIARIRPVEGVTSW